VLGKAIKQERVDRPQEFESTRFSFLDPDV
jgi:hypothetical protein